MRACLLPAFVVVAFSISGCAPNDGDGDPCSLHEACAELPVCVDGERACASDGMTCACVEGCWQRYLAPCADAGRADAGRCPPSGMPALRDGECTDEAPVCNALGDGCDCVGGCWVCASDRCRVVDVPMLDASIDASEALDAGALDTPLALDAPATPPDVPADAGVPPTATYCVDIFVSNTCEMTVTPSEIDVPADQTAYFCWRNTSRDYPVDVWLSYGGGYTDLAPGATWNEPPGHCLGPTPHDEYADITTACSSHRFLIHCL